MKKPNFAVLRKLHVNHAVLNAVFWILLIGLPISIAGIVMTYQWIKIHDIGQIVTNPSLGLYYVNGTKVPLPFLMDWGNISIGQSKSETFIIRNEGQANITLLFNYTDFETVPSNLYNFVSVRDNYNGAVLHPYEDATVTFMIFFFNDVGLPNDSEIAFAFDIDIGTV